MVTLRSILVGTTEVGTVTGFVTGTVVVVDSTVVVGS